MFIVYLVYLGIQKNQQNMEILKFISQNYIVHLLMWMYWNIPVIDTDLPVCLRTWWRVTWCTQCVRRWRSWRSRSRSWSSVTPSWSRRTPCWKRWPARSRWPSSRPRFRPVPRLRLRQLLHRDPRATPPLSSPPCTALARRRSLVCTQTNWLTFFEFCYSSSGAPPCLLQQEVTLLRQEFAHIYLSEGCSWWDRRCSASKRSRGWQSWRRCMAGLVSEQDWIIEHLPNNPWTYQLECLTKKKQNKSSVATIYLTID